MSNNKEWRVFQRADSKYWWAYIKSPVPGQDPIRRSTGTVEKTQAEAWAKQAAETLWRHARLGIEPEHTWEEAVVRWIAERQDKTTIEEDVQKFKWLHPYLGGKRLSEISRSLVMEVATAKAQESSQATANRYTALISAVIHRSAVEWSWLEHAPSFYKFKEPKKRIRYLTPEQANTLLNELPDHQRDIMIFGISTGLRQGNILALEWSQVDIARRAIWIHADQAKGREALSVPINETTLNVLIRNMGKHPIRVFTFKGQPIKKVNTKAWQKALARAGIENFRWHDLRHTFASWLAMSGATSREIQDMGGWKDDAMVGRYAHLSADHLINTATKLDTFFARSPSKDPA